MWDSPVYVICPYIFPGDFKSSLPTIFTVQAEAPPRAIRSWLVYLCPSCDRHTVRAFWMLELSLPMGEHLLEFSPFDSDCAIFRCCLSVQKLREILPMIADVSWTYYHLDRDHSSWFCWNWDSSLHLPTWRPQCAVWGWESSIGSLWTTGLWSHQQSSWIWSSR